MLNAGNSVVHFKKCPLFMANPNNQSETNCVHSECAWWCGPQNECAIKTIAVEFITRNG